MAEILVAKRNCTLSADSLTASVFGSDGYATSTTPKASGKLYFEALPNSATGQELIGILDSEITPPTDVAFFAIKSLSLSTFDGTLYGSGNSRASWGSSAKGAKIGFAVDIDNKTIKYTKDGSSWSASKSWSGWSTSGIVVFLTTGTGATYSTTVNFGGSTFSYAVPDGYSAWDAAAAPAGQPYII